MSIACHILLTSQPYNHNAALILQHSNTCSGVRLKARRNHPGLFLEPPQRGLLSVHFVSLHMQFIPVIFVTGKRSIQKAF